MDFEKVLNAHVSNNTERLYLQPKPRNQRKRQQILEDAKRIKLRMFT